MSDAVAVGRSAAAAPGLFGLLPDRHLVRLAARGEQRAFAAIFRRYHQDLYRYCLAVVGDPQDAQDALQDAMVSAMRALPGERREIELRPWLYRVAHNRSVDLLRRRRASEPLDVELTAGGPQLAERSEQRERLRRLLGDLEDLPERQRAALLMRELGGLDFRQIGAALDASPAVVRQAIYEARLNLRQIDAGREMGCDEVMRAISDADGRIVRRRDIRAHLRDCEGCRAFREGIRGRRADLAAIPALPAGIAATILSGTFGGGSGGGGIAAAVGLGAGGGAGASVALKSAATVAALGAIGVGAAERGGPIDAGLPGGNPAPQAEVPFEGGALPTGASSSELARRAAKGGPGRRPGYRGAGAAEPAMPGSGASSGQAAMPPGRSKTEPASDDGLGGVAYPGAGGHEPQSGHGAVGATPPRPASFGQQTAAGHKRGAGAPGGGQVTDAPGAGGGAGHSNPPKPPQAGEPPPPPPKPVEPGRSANGAGPPASAPAGPAEAADPKAPADPPAAPPSAAAAG